MEGGGIGRIGGIGGIGGIDTNPSITWIDRIDTNSDTSYVCVLQSNRVIFFFNPMYTYLHTVHSNSVIPANFVHTPPRVITVQSFTLLDQSEPHCYTIYYIYYI